MLVFLSWDSGQLHHVVKDTPLEQRRSSYIGKLYWKQRLQTLLLFNRGVFCCHCPGVSTGVPVVAVLTNGRYWVEGALWAKRIAVLPELWAVPDCQLARMDQCAYMAACHKPQMQLSCWLHAVAVEAKPPCFNRCEGHAGLRLRFVCQLWLQCYSLVIMHLMLWFTTFFCAGKLACCRPW